MPFITEELWQRLPRRAFDNAPSICVASYPEAVEVPPFSSLQVFFYIYCFIMNDLGQHILFVFNMYKNINFCSTGYNQFTFLLTFASP